LSLCGCFFEWFLTSSLLVRSASGAILVNEIASAGNAAFCASADYIELYNSDPNPVDISGYFLSDKKNNFQIPSGTIIAAGGFKTYCKDLVGSFTFGIGKTETISLKLPNGVEIFSTTLNGQGTSTSTYQRLPDGSYAMGPPSPNAANAVPVAVINEVAPAGTSDTSICGGGPFIEIANVGAGSFSLSGFKLYNASSFGPNSPTAYTFGAGDSVAFGGFAVFCKGTTFQFDIAQNDVITLRNANGQDVSTTGAIGGTGSRPKAVDLVWARSVDLISLTNPDPPFYQCSKNPTPGRPNVFPFEPIQTTLQNCGIQTAPLTCLADYELKETLLFDGYPTSPEFSGGTVDGSTCNHLIVNDEGNIFDMSISGGTVQLKRTIPFIGGTRDNEGMCYYSPGKIAVVDERERSGTCPKSVVVFDRRGAPTHFVFFLDHTCSCALRRSPIKPESTFIPREFQLQGA
jgi:Lamin Tail Domain